MKNLNKNSFLKSIGEKLILISSTSQEQLASVDQIDKTLSSLDENIQKNAALVEEAASSTQELSTQAQELNTTMQLFKIDTNKKKTPTPSSRSSKPEKALLEKSVIEKRQGNTGLSKDANSYESFADLADEGEFDEF